MYREKMSSYAFLYDPSNEYESALAGIVNSDVCKVFKVGDELKGDDLRLMVLGNKEIDNTAHFAEIRRYSADGELTLHDFIMHLPIVPDPINNILLVNIIAAGWGVENVPDAAKSAVCDSTFALLLEGINFEYKQYTLREAFAAISKSFNPEKDFDQLVIIGYACKKVNGRLIKNLMDARRSHFCKGVVKTECASFSVVYYPYVIAELIEETLDELQNTKESVNFACVMTPGNRYEFAELIIDSEASDSEKNSDVSATELMQILADKMGGRFGGSFVELPASPFE